MAAQVRRPQGEQTRLLNLNLNPLVTMPLFPQLALAHQQSKQEGALSSLSHQLALAASEAAGRMENASRLEADRSRLNDLVEEKNKTIQSLEDQVEDLGKSLSKINTQYQKQFARIEADQASVVGSVKEEAQAQVEAIKSEAQALLGRRRNHTDTSHF